MSNTITSYINNGNWDFRIKNNTPLFIEQKVEPTNIHLYAQAILNYKSKSFSNRDIYESSTVSRILQITMGKPAASYTPHEVNKLFGQQLSNFFWFCGLLNCTKKGRSYIFSIVLKNKWLIELLSISLMSALEFQALLYEKLAQDSGFGKELTKLKNNLNNPKINIAKQELANFQNNTFYPFLEKYTDKGQKPYSADRGRVIPKFINPIAVFRRKKGRDRGGLSNHIYTLPDLNYNKLNWKDIAQGKNKGISRQQFNKANKNTAVNLSVPINYQPLITKMKQNTNNQSEHNKSEPGLHGHHIFMRSMRPEFTNYQENIILISANEHSQVHSHGTQYIDTKTTFDFLKSKLKIVTSDPVFYSIVRFKEIIMECLENEAKHLNIDLYKPNISLSKLRSEIIKLENHCLKKYPNILPHS